MLSSISLRLITGVVLLATTALPQEAPKLRLDGNVKPKEYTVKLQIVPNEERLSGLIQIDIEARQPSKLIWLNASDEIRIEEASLGRKSRMVRILCLRR